MKGGKTLGMQLTSTKDVTVLDEIIDNASGLPLESQDWLLMIAKSMRYTRDCIVRKNKAEPPVNNHRSIT
jgi:hypothetical protein